MKEIVASTGNSRVAMIFLDNKQNKKGGDDFFCQYKRLNKKVEMIFLANDKYK